MPATSSDRLFASLADAAACRTSLRGGSRSFFAASLVLPKSVREPATGLYAFCRMADDAVDRGRDKCAALQDLRLRLEWIYAGDPRDDAADRAFADTVRRFAIPKAFPRALLEGFQWDADNRRYDNLSQLVDYGVRVAGSVGAMMAMLMGVRDPALIARACDLGVAMQLTNIARDVGEDARSGRLYLPRDWLREMDVEPEEWLACPSFDARIAAVIERLLAAAEVLYARSDAGIAQLPKACRPGMYAARLLYCEIGREVSRRKFDSVNQRAVVSWQRKARLMADAMLAATSAASSPAAWAPSASSPAAWDGAAPTGEILTEAQFLLDQLPHARPGESAARADSPRGSARRPRVEDRVVWLVELFERLERRDRAVHQT